MTRRKNYHPRRNFFLSLIIYRDTHIHGQYIFYYTEGVDFVCFYYIICVIFLVFFLKNFGSKKVLLSLLRNKDEMLSSFMPANAMFLRLSGTVHCRLVQ
jgi:hypothetical protein